MPPINFENLAKSAFDQVKCTLGSDIIYRPKAGGVHNIRGVFDDRAQEVDPDTEQPISSNVFSLGVKLADLPAAPQKGDIVVYMGATFHVIDALEDGVPTASVVLILHKAKL